MKRYLALLLMAFASYAWGGGTCTSSAPTCTPSGHVAGSAGANLVEADIQQSDGLRVYANGATFNLLFTTRATVADTLNWAINDVFGNTMKSGSFAVTSGNVLTTVPCSLAFSGYFTVTATLTGEGGTLPVMGTRPSGIATFGILANTGLPAPTYAFPDQHRFGMQGFNHNYPALIDMGVHWTLDSRGQTWGEPSAPNTYTVSNDLGPDYTAHTDQMRIIRLDNIPAWNNTDGNSDDYGFPINTVEFQGYMAKIGTDTANIHTTYYPTQRKNYYQGTWEPSLSMPYPSASFCCSSTSLQATVYNGIHSTDPNAVVTWTANPFPNGNNNGTGNWIAQYQPSGFCNFIDAVTTHGYYNAGDFAAHPPEYQNQISGAAANALNNEMHNLRATMQACKPNMKLFATEAGNEYDTGIAYGSAAITGNELWGQAMVGVRSHIIVLGEGAQITTFFFGPDYPAEIGYGTFFDVAPSEPNGNLGGTNLSPKPVAMALSALTRVLDGTNTLGIINNMPSTGYGYAFQQLGGGPIISAVWAHDNGHWTGPGAYSSTYSVPYSLTVDNAGTSGNVTVIDVWGNPISVSYTNGQVALTLTESPIYVVSFNAGATLTHVTAPVGYTGQ